MGLGIALKTSYHSGFISLPTKHAHFSPRRENPLNQQLACISSLSALPVASMRTERKSSFRHIIFGNLIALLGPGSRSGLNTLLGERVGDLPGDRAGVERLIGEDGLRVGEDEAALRATAARNPGESSCVGEAFRAGCVWNFPNV